MELEWVTNHLASCCHAAEGIARGLPLADSRLGEPFVIAAQALGKEISLLQVPSDKRCRKCSTICRIDFARFKSIGKLAVPVYYMPSGV
ncbi:MAG: hypothetical protein HYV60_20030 [Planctomycetia bacterium]|nr:hypothetical protein [Planctomycetia bacterium]